MIKPTRRIMFWFWVVVVALVAMIWPWEQRARLLRSPAAPASVPASPVTR
jgi:hypothetical protein